MTTRTRNPFGLFRLRRRLGSAAAHPLGLCSLGFHAGIATPFRLPTRGLPAVQLTTALRILAVPLVPLPGEVLAPAPFTQAQTLSRASDSGTATVVWLIVVGAHGSSVFLPGKLGENARYILSGRLSKQEEDDSV